MDSVLSNLARTIDICSSGEGFQASPLPGVYCIKLSHTDSLTKRTWRASFYVTAQGCKEIILGGQVYRAGEGHYAFSLIDLPVASRIYAASPEKPFLCLRIDFDPLTLSEMSAQFERDVSDEIDNPLRAIFLGKAGEKMLDALGRLGNLFQTAEDAPILGPLVTKEIFFHLLKGPDGPAIRQYVRSGSKMQKISQAVYRLKSNLSDDPDVAALAKEANMSRSAFFKHFKEATAMSPIQYQKRLRLLEARRLLVDEGETAESAAFKVGYRSASQFSREYSRLFGNSPLRDATQLKQNGNALQQI